MESQISDTKEIELYVYLFVFPKYNDNYICKIYFY